jgi:hypothetical protein
VAEIGFRVGSATLSSCHALPVLYDQPGEITVEGVPLAPFLVGESVPNNALAYSMANVATASQSTVSSFGEKYDTLSILH